jgi:hypothetical protein
LTLTTTLYATTQKTLFRDHGPNDCENGCRGVLIFIPGPTKRHFLPLEKPAGIIVIYFTGRGYATA